MATRIHTKNVHDKSPENVHGMSPKERTSHGQKCPEMSPKVSTRCHLFCSRDITYYVYEMSATQLNLHKQKKCDPVAAHQPQIKQTSEM